jgi:outer membrane protein TolC
VDEESPLAQFDVTPAAGEPLVDSMKKKLWRWPQFDALFPNKNKPRKEKEAHSARYETDFSQDGEALYKAAVADNRVTVEEAVEISLAKNTKIQAAKKNVEVADAKLTETKRALLPTVQAVLELNGGKVPGVSGSRFYKGGNQKLNVTQPLYSGGELANTVKQAEENVRVAKAEYKKAKDDMIHQVRVAYYGVVKAEYNAEYQLELYEKIMDLVKKVKQQREARVVAEIDYLNLESQYYQVLYQVEASKNDVLSTNVSLKQSMNLDVDGAVPVDLKMNFMKVAPALEELTNRAIQSNADIRVRAFAVEAAKYGIDIYESKKKPHFELRGSYGMLGEAFHDTVAFEDGKASLDREKEWFLGVHGSMPLGPNSIAYEQTKHVYGPTVLSLTGSEDWKHHMEFNLWDKFGDITDEKQAQYALLQAESDYRSAKDEVTLRLREEFYSLQRYLIQIDSSISKLRYRNKQITILGYLMNLQETSPSNYVGELIEQVQDRYSFIQAVADYNVAMSSVGLLIGDPYYFENQRLISPEKYETTDVTEAQDQ